MLAVAGVVVLAVAVPVGLRAVSSAAPRSFRGSQPPARIELPRFSLRDETGRPVSSDKLRGKAVAVTFLDTKCTDSCPIIGEQIRQAFARLTPRERDDAVAVAISVQPDDDK